MNAFHGGRVVGSVTDDAGRQVDQFHASGKVGLGQILEHALLVALEFTLAKFINNRDGQASVDGLVLAGAGAGMCMLTVVADDADSAV